ncbi:hypothetical protein BJX99DRAFT_236825 [Aspergillus californicus]
MPIRNDAYERRSRPKPDYREGLHLRPLNVEKGSDRYPRADDPLPQIAHFRCNLTALSQRRNLLFVAYGQQIHIWEPSGASQALGSRPEIIITPVMKEPNARGYIEPAFPHEINSILVDDLGREEVLLLGTDSGNVCGYRVEAIFSALERAAESGKAKPLDSAEVEPFFLEHVGQSAWGLAIHKFARLIAVTANTGLVYVFAFALVNPSSGTGDDTLHRLEEDDAFVDCGQTWLDIRTNEQFKQLQELMPGKHRTRNIKLSYTGHFANIPSVAFLNCDLDPNGAWMVSTDIDNKVLVWKIWESLGPFNIYYFNEMSLLTHPAPRYHNDRGWSVIALDPRTFHFLKTTEEACSGEPHRLVRNGYAILDLSRLSKGIPDTSREYNYFPPAIKAKPDETVLPDIFGEDCLIRGNSDIREKPEYAPSVASLPTGLGSLRPSDSTDALSHQAVDGSFHADNMSEDDVDQDLGDQEVAGYDSMQDIVESDDLSDAVPPNHEALATAQLLQHAVESGDDLFEIQALLDANSVQDADSDDDSFQVEHHRTGPSNVDTSDASEDEEIQYQIFDPPTDSNFPILHFTHTDIHLIPHPFAFNATVVSGNPLRQDFIPIVSIGGFDRFNMVKYIPEHGIVVAASQKGRAAIIALTESRVTGRTFRVDWIVPLESQEKYGERPLIPLLGMSVGPMQGFEIPPDVSYIPRESNTEDDPVLSFQYRDTNIPSPSPRPKMNPSLSRSTPEPNLSIPEQHAKATCAYQPEESWRGWNPSRRYRLLLIYADHTVMSYEFWYTWNVSSPSAPGGSGNFDGNEDDFLIL